MLSFVALWLGPGLVDTAQARPSDTCVFSWSCSCPPRPQPWPTREALAIVLFGAKPRSM